MNQKEINLAVRKAGLGDVTTFTLSREHLLENTRTEITIAVPDEQLREGGWWDGMEHSEHVATEVQDAVAKAVETAREECIADLDGAVFTLLAAAEDGRLADHPDISPTDVALFGETVALARAVSALFAGVSTEPSDR